MKVSRFELEEMIVLADYDTVFVRANVLSHSLSMVGSRSSRTCGREVGCSIDLEGRAGFSGWPRFLERIDLLRLEGGFEVGECVYDLGLWYTPWVIRLD